MSSVKARFGSRNAAETVKKQKKSEGKTYTGTRYATFVRSTYIPLAASSSSSSSNGNKNEQKYLTEDNTEEC